VILGWVNAGSAIACGLCMSSLLHRATEPFFGLVERIFYASMLAWFAIVAIHLLAS
jgi:ABC-type multidrug transport system permease subunit